MSNRKIIDVHSHMMPSCYLNREREIQNRVERKGEFPAPAWTIENHVKLMEEAGIDDS